MHVEVVLDIALHVLPVAVLVDTREDVAVGHVVDFPPELRVLVGFEHFIGSGIGEDAVEQHAQISAKGESDAEEDPIVDGLAEGTCLQSNKSIHTAEHKYQHEDGVYLVIGGVVDLSVHQLAEETCWPLSRIFPVRRDDEEAPQSQSHQYEVDVGRGHQEEDGEEDQGHEGQFEGDEEVVVQGGSVEFRKQLMKVRTLGFPQELFLRSQSQSCQYFYALIAFIEHCQINWRIPILIRLIHIGSQFCELGQYLWQVVVSRPGDKLLLVYIDIP